MEFKTLSLQVKADDVEGVITGYGAVFGNKDSYGDVIEPGAFTETLGRRKVKMLWQHRMDEPIGVWDEVREDESGLHVKGRIALATSKGREGYELVKMGAMDGLSIGFRTVQDQMDGDIRRIKAIDLYEVSLVTMPANSLATVTGVKGEMTERQFEALLGDMGFSRWDRKIIIAGGFKAWAGQRDAGGSSLDADQRDAEAIKSELMQLLKGVSQ